MGVRELLRWARPGLTDTATVRRCRVRGYARPRPGGKKLRTGGAISAGGFPAGPQSCGVSPPSSSHSGSCHAAAAVPPKTEELLYVITAVLLLHLGRISLF